MTRPIRIAQLALHTALLATPGGYKAGGMNVYVRELARQLDRGGNLVDIFTRRQRGDEPRVVPIGNGARVIHLDSVPIDATNDALLGRSAEMADEIAAFAEEERISYDIAHSHYWVSGPVGNDLSARWDIPHIVMFHTLGEVKNRVHLAEREPEHRIQSERETVMRADRIVCASDHEADMLHRLYGALPGQTAVIPCGVDLHHFRPAHHSEARMALGLSDEPLVLYVGRVEPLKGIELLISAFARIAAGRDQRLPRLLIVGGDARSAPEITTLRELAAELGVEERITFRGPVPHSELPLYYNAADVCVVPSFYESWGMVAIESMAAGTPVVASRVGGLAANIQDGVTGYLVAKRSAEPFAERMSALLSDACLRHDMGLAARHSVETLGWERVMERVLRLYESARVEREKQAS